MDIKNSDDIKLVRERLGKLRQEIRHHNNCYYNNDAIEQFLFNNGMDQFSQSPSLQCIRFQQLPTKTKTTIHSNFIKALDTCKLLIQYDCLFFLFYHLYFLLFITKISIKR